MKTQKKNDDTVETAGTLVGERERAKANKFSDKKRQSLLTKGIDLLGKEPKFDPTRDPYACEPGKEKEAANRRFCEHLRENPEEFSEEIFVRRLSEVLRRGRVSRRKAASVLKLELEDLAKYLRSFGYEPNELW